MDINDLHYVDQGDCVDYPYLFKLLIFAGSKGYDPDLIDSWESTVARMVMAVDINNLVDWLKGREDLVPA